MLAKHHIIIVKGTITEINQKCQTYRILCKLESGHIEEWFKVSDITSLAYEEEKKKAQYYILRWELLKLLKIHL